MKKIKLAVVGCLGRMGKEIIKEINISPNCELVSAIEVKKTTIKRISKIEISKITGNVMDEHKVET